MKDLGAKAFSYGYASPVLMAATYNDDDSVNVMNLHEVARTNAGDLVCCIGKPKKTHENIEKRKAFTITLANESFMKEIDYLGTVSGYRVPDKFERTGLKTVKSKHVDAPVIVGSPVVIECELIEFIETDNFTAVLARVVNIAADESVLGEDGKIDTGKIGMIFYESFSNSYYKLGDKVGNRNSVDMVIAVNGIPVFAFELKNQYTGQTVENSKRQWMYDRDARELCFRFNSRILAFFCVDLLEAAMTTKLDGKDTFFLPFNQGSNGAGEDGGKGNPANPDGYPTAYLWENVFQKDSMMDILQKFMSLKIDEEKTLLEGGREQVIKKKKLLFPRYHQLHVVRSLIADVRELCIALCRSEQVQCDHERARRSDLS